MHSSEAVCATEDEGEEDESSKRQRLEEDVEDVIVKNDNESGKHFFIYILFMDERVSKHT